MRKKIFYITPKNIDWQIIDILINNVDVIIYKNATDEFTKKVSEVKRLIELSERTIIIIDEDFELLKETNAHGLNISSNNKNPILLRDRIDKRKLFGFNAKTLLDVQTAYDAGCDYITVGNIYPSITRQNLNIITEDEIKIMKVLTEIPLIIGGGLTAENITESLLKLGEGFIFGSYFSVDTIERLTKVFKLLRG